jgi:hypothetical protein
MITAAVTELKRLSPHGATLVAPVASAPNTSAQGRRSLGGSELMQDRGAAARGAEDRARS